MNWEKRFKTHKMYEEFIRNNEYVKSALLHPEQYNALLSNSDFNTPQ